MAHLSLCLSLAACLSRSQSPPRAWLSRSSSHSAPFPRPSLIPHLHLFSTFDACARLLNSPLGAIPAAPRIRVVAGLDRPLLSFFLFLFFFCLIRFICLGSSAPSILPRLLSEVRVAAPGALDDMPSPIAHECGIACTDESFGHVDTLFMKQTLLALTTSSAQPPRLRITTLFRHCAFRLSYRLLRRPMTFTYS